MRIINDGSNDTLFTVDGLPYRKGLYEVFYNKEADSKITVGIRTIYNQVTLNGPILPSQYLVNGSTFTDSQIIELVTALSLALGFNTGGGGSSEIPTLQEVTDAGNSTDKSIISTVSVDSPTLNVTNGGSKGSFTGASISADREYELPDKSGLIALISDVNPSITILSTQNHEITETRGVVMLTVTQNDTKIDLPSLASSVGIIIVISNASNNSATISSHVPDGAVIWEHSGSSDNTVSDPSFLKIMINDGIMFRTGNSG